MIERKRLEKAGEILYFLNCAAATKIMDLLVEYPEGLSQVQVKNIMGVQSWSTINRTFIKLVKYRLIKRVKTGEVKNGRYIYTIDDYYWSLLSHAVDKIYYLDAV